MSAVAIVHAKLEEGNNDFKRELATVLVQGPIRALL